MLCKQRFDRRHRPFSVFLLALCGLALIFSGHVADAADDGLNFEADPLLQDLLSKRAARQKQENQSSQDDSEPKQDKANTAKSAPSSKRQGKPNAQSKATPDKKTGKTTTQAPGIGQGLIQFESKSSRVAKEKATQPTPMPAPMPAPKRPPMPAPKPAPTATTTTATPAPANKLEEAAPSRDTLYSPQQLKEFEEASDWIKPRSDAAKVRRPREVPGMPPLKIDSTGTSAAAPRPAPAPVKSPSNKTPSISPSAEKAAAKASIEPAESSVKPAEPIHERDTAIEGIDLKTLQGIQDSSDVNSADKLDKADAMEIEKDIDVADKKLDSVSGASVKEYIVPENEPVAVAWHRERAQNGDVDAQYNLAVIYATGFGVKQDFRNAAWWFEQAANQKNAQAQLRLGMLYIIGLGVDSSIIKGTSLIQDAANQGVSLARVINDKLLAKPIDGLDIAKTMSKVRQTYLKKNEKVAADELLKIVARAEIDAETNRKADRFNGQATGSAAKPGTVGNHIPSFLAPSKPQTEIIIGDPVARIRRHAKEGNVDAQYEYARMLDTGHSLPRDRQQALAWYSKAASKDHSGALYYLAIAHLYGLGVPADIPKGREMLKHAAALKQPIAQKLLAYLSDGKKEIIEADSSAALAWNLDLAMNENDPDAMSALGHIFNMGWGVQQNSEEGQTWLRKARAAGGKGADRELRRMKIEKMMQSKAKDKSPAAEISNNSKALTSEPTKAAENAPVATTSTAPTSLAVPSSTEIAAANPTPASTANPSDSTAAIQETALVVAAAQAGDTSDKSADNRNITRGTLPSNSPAARKAEARKLTEQSGQSLIRRPKVEAPKNFWENVKMRLRNLFHHDDDPFKPVFLIIMGGLIGLAVFKGLRNRDLRKYRQGQEQSSPFG